MGSKFAAAAWAIRAADGNRSMMNPGQGRRQGFLSRGSKIQGVWVAALTKSLDLGNYMLTTGRRWWSRPEDRPPAAAAGPEHVFV